MAMPRLKGTGQEAGEKLFLRRGGGGGKSDNASAVTKSGHRTLRTARLAVIQPGGQVHEKRTTKSSSGKTGQLTRVKQRSDVRGTL